MGAVTVESGADDDEQSSPSNFLECSKIVLKVGHESTEASADATWTLESLNSRVVARHEQQQQQKWQSYTCARIVNCRPRQAHGGQEVDEDEPDARVDRRGREQMSATDRTGDVISSGPRPRTELIKFG
jgi:hypothetical protein